jgi:hypothetical protein
MQSQFEALLSAIQKELQDLEAGAAVELKKLEFANVSVAASAFVSDTTNADYPFRASVPLSGAIETMIPDVVLGLSDAISGIFAPVAECYNGGVYLYASAVPEASVAIPTIILWRGTEASKTGKTNAGGGGGLSMELVWVNGSPTSSMKGGATATVVGLGGYDLIAIKARWSASIGGHNMYFGSPGETVNMSMFATTNHSAARTVIIDTVDTITFNSGSYDGNNNTSYMIPLKIYGIKGVKK